MTFALRTASHACGFSRRSAFRVAPGISATFLLTFGLGLIPLGRTAAQDTGSVAGTVSDAVTGDALSGAQVVLMGTERGALSDARGRYIILNVPSGNHTVRVIRLGYGTQQQATEVAPGATAVADFELHVSAVALDEIVVTGTGGEVERRKVGASVASVPVSQLVEQVPLESLGQSLQARIPGVRSVGTVGGVGAGRDLRIRGTTSFRLNQRPVVYVDGVRMDASQHEWGGTIVGGGLMTTCCWFSGGAGEDRLHDLNPEEIERVEVLKGAAAATLYGSEASSGVIQIFTKTGRSNSPPRFTLNASVGFNRHRSNFPTKLFPEFRGPDGYRAWDANERLIESGLINTWDLTTQGGGEEVTYFASGGFNFEEGSIKPNWLKKGNVRMNLRWVASERWAFSLNTAYSRNRVFALQSGNNWLAQLGNALIGNPRRANDLKPFGEPWAAVEDIKEIDTFSDASRWTGGLTVTHETTEAFTNRLSIGFDQVDDQKSRFLPFGNVYVYLPDGEGEKNLGYRTTRNVTADYLGTLSFDLAEDLGSELSYGMQGFWESDSYLMAVGRDYAGPGVTTIGGAAVTLSDEVFDETINVGAFAQNRFSWRDKVFATLGVRVDGNSAFGESYGLKAYPKGEFVYDLSHEEFLPEMVSNLRFRAAVGQAGMFPGAFDRFRTYEPVPVLDDLPGVTPDNPGNADLKPETTTEIELGFDAGFLEDRVGLSLTVFRADTRDALLPIRLAPSRGFSETSLQNAGHIRNKGWELSLTATPLNTSGFRWNTTLNLDGIENEVQDLGPQAVWVQRFKGLDELGNEVTDSVLAFGSYWVGFPSLFRKSRKAIGYDPATKKHRRSSVDAYVGPTLPTFNASWGNTLSFGPFRLFALLSAEKGAWFNNSTRRFQIMGLSGDEYLGLFDFENRDDLGNPTNNAPADSLLDLASTIGFSDQRDHVRLREVSLTFQVPSDLTARLGLSSTTLTLSGLNLHWWDDCNCMDPNATLAGGDWFWFSSFLATPQPRQFLLTLRTRF